MQQFQYQIDGPNVRSIYYGIRKEFGVANEYISPTGNTYFFVFESFSFLQNSDMSCTILVDVWSDNSCFVQAVVSGGKSGLFRLDIFGREGSRLGKLQEAFQRICHYNQWRMMPFQPAPRMPANLANAQQAPPPQGQVQQGNSQQSAPPPPQQKGVIQGNPTMPQKPPGTK